jgi:hypothetical protein
MLSKEEKKHLKIEVDDMISTFQRYRYNYNPDKPDELGLMIEGIILLLGDLYDAL